MSVAARCKAVLQSNFKKSHIYYLALWLFFPFFPLIYLNHYRQYHVTLYAKKSQCIFYVYGTLSTSISFEVIICHVFSEHFSTNLRLAFWTRFVPICNPVYVILSMQICLVSFCCPVPRYPIVVTRYFFFVSKILPNLISVIEFCPLAHEEKHFPTIREHP